MSADATDPGWVPYQKCNFHTLLPADYRYTEGHFWLGPQGDGVWRVGLTQFAVRMLGEMVDHSFQALPGSVVQVGDAIGSLEGFKAMADLYCVARGEFLGGNEALRERGKLLSTHPYTDGWLYAIRGEPDPAAVNVAGYAALLDEVIERLRAKQGEEE